MGSYWSKNAHHCDVEKNRQQEIRIILVGKTGLGNPERNSHFN